MFGQENGRRVIATIVICMGLLIVWQYFFSPKSKKEKEQPAPAATLDAGVDAMVAEAPEADAEVITIDGAVLADGGVAPAVVVTLPKKETPLDKPKQPDLAKVKEVTVPVDTPLIHAEFSNYGGALKSWTLKHPQYYEHVDGKRQQIEMVDHAGDPKRYGFALDIPEGTARLPPVPIYDCKADGQNKYKVVCKYTPDGPGLGVERTYTIDPDTYVVDMNLKLINNSNVKIIETAEVKVGGFQDPNKKTRSTSFFSRPSGDSAQSAVCHYNGKLKVAKPKELDKKGKIQLAGKIRFAGIETKYFAFLLVPHRDSSPESRECVRRGTPGQRGMFEAAVRFAKSGELENGQFQEVAVGAYIGPKILSQLDAVRFEEGENPKLTSVIELGWSLVAPIARLMLWILRSIHEVVPNWGLCIILLTLLVKLLTLPLVVKQMRAAKEMQKLKPKIDEIKKKYASEKWKDQKDAKQREQIETMNLYKAHKINPLGGCLPALIQAPIWIALYGALGNAGELFQAPFAGWLQNLTSPDPYYILPLAVGGITFLQQKITPQPVDNQQAKIMLWMMPIMLTVFGIFFPAGLSLYMFTNAALTVGHQYYMNRGDRTLGKATAAKKA